MRLTGKQLAAFYGKNERTITRWLDSDPPCPSEMVDGHRVFDSVAVVEWREDRVRAQAERAVRSADFEKARTRKMVADADMTELELARERNELVSVEAFRDTLRKILTSIRAQLLSIPGRYALRTVGSPTLAESTRAWTSAIHDVMRELRDGPGSDYGAAKPAIVRDDTAHLKNDPDKP